MLLNRHITVQDLIDLLMKVEDKSLLVDTDGCDCQGPSDGIEVFETTAYKGSVDSAFRQKRVLIHRNDLLTRREMGIPE